MLVASPKSNVGCAAGYGLTGSWSDSWSERSRIVSDRPHKPRIANDVSAVFGKLPADFGLLIFVPSTTVFGGDS